MEKYSIFCSEEQTRKAMALGAPIRKKVYPIEILNKCNLFSHHGQIRIIPTAEEMIGWLEEQGVLCDVFPTGDFWNDRFGMRIMKKTKILNRFESDAINYPTRQEAALAAIDAALEYLVKTKEEENESK